MKHYLHRVELLHDEVPDFGIYPFCLDAVRLLSNCIPRSAFSSARMARASRRSWKAIAVAWGFNAEGGSRNVHFDTRRSHSPLHVSPPVQACLDPETATFCAQRASLTSPRMMRSTRSGHPRVRGLRRPVSARAVAARLWPCFCSVDARSLFSTSPKPRCRRRGRWPCSLACTSWLTRGSQDRQHSPLVMAYPGGDDLRAAKRVFDRLTTRSKTFSDNAALSKRSSAHASRSFMRANRYHDNS